MRIEVYSDGSATTRDKPGGYAWVIVINGIKYSEGSGSLSLATNNDAELESSIRGLAHALKIMSDRPEGWMQVDVESVTLVSDSEIVLKWANGSQRFKQEAKMAKFLQLQFLMRRLKAKTRWVKGHSGDEHNERCDKLASAERDRAMGRPEKRKVKNYKKACEEMAKVLRYIKQECEDLRASKFFTRDDFIDQAEEALEVYEKL